MKAIERELFRNLFVSVAEEMGIVLRRTAFSPNIKERRDYSCALYDGSGGTVAMGDHMPVHLGAMPLSVAAALESFAFEPGDVAILNDPFRGGTHLPDITAISGVFLPGDVAPAFYVASRAHHADIGGMSPGSMPLAREIYQEGLRLPPILLVRRGRMDQPLLDLILANVRTPDERRGDLMAQIAANSRGEERLLEMASKHGRETLDRNMHALQDYSEAMMRTAIAQIPDGEYVFSDYLDEDGAGSGPVEIRVKIRVAGDTVNVDFSGSSSQVTGCVNANYAVAVSATAYVFRCVAGPFVSGDIPYNSGLLRPISIHTPKRSVVNAGPPAAMAAGNVETSQRITDTLFGALAQALPALIPAASSGTMNNLTIGGWDPRLNKPFAYYETIAGGSGASPEGAGASAIHTHMTNSWNTPAEAFEHEYPMRIRRYEIRRGSGGAGKYEGGDGIVRAIEFLAPAEVTILSDRRVSGPWGLEGGGNGAPGRNLLVRDGVEMQIAAKARFDVRAGVVLRVEPPGGGGWGRAALRSEPRP
jgi:N-methylhydantoinase B/oxoprolinase/acetone carboxylase alpha subunit